MVLSKKIILPSFDYTFTNACISLAFSNILIPFAVKLFVTFIPFLFKTFLFLYIVFVVYETNFTIMGCGLAFIYFFGFPSICDLSMSSFSIFWFICSSTLLLLLWIIHRYLHLLLHQLHESKAVTSRILFLPV